MKRDAEEAENRQKKAAQSDAVANFTTLLNEMVKDVGARWPEWWPKLQRDPQVDFRLSCCSDLERCRQKRH